MTAFILSQKCKNKPSVKKLQRDFLYMKDSGRNLKVNEK